ncbi:MAG: biotin synthase BioB [Rikenellaceae bacterium]|nr:biotin synthase BioB [Rikenellaceae bacterium]
MRHEIDFESLKRRITEGYVPDVREALELTKRHNREGLWALADDLRRHYQGDYFDTCSIINARSGRCPEDCKWCAQSVRYKTDIDIYPLVDGTKAVRLAQYNASFNIRRFSFVTSGRSVTGDEIERLASYASDILEATDMTVCASLGLVSRDDMQRLYDSGVTRYHCNLESSPSFFRKLCTTHTTEQKIETLRNAKSVGMSVCSGGIIGMGETMRDRIEMALVLRDIGVDSIPVNVLNPIKGTPLEGSAPLKPEEVMTSFAIIKVLNPESVVRMAGGQSVISAYKARLLSCGVSGAILGDMLTTGGDAVRDDMKMIRAAGFGIVPDDCD